MAVGARTRRDVVVDALTTRRQVVRQFGKLVTDAVGEIVENGWYPSSIHPNNSPKAAKLNDAETVLLGRKLEPGEVPIADALKLAIKDPALGEGGPNLGERDYREYLNERETFYFGSHEKQAPASQSKPLGELAVELVEAHKKKKGGDATATEQITQTEAQITERAQEYGGV